MPLAFNRRSERQNFIYRHNPARPGSFLILRLDPARGGYDPVGVYMVVDETEEMEITEKKLINMILILNNQGDEVQKLGFLTGKRVLFNIEDRGSGPNGKATITFRTYDGQGVSCANAVLEIERGVFDGDG